MTHNDYLSRLMLLGYETGRGNPNAHADIFGQEQEHDCHQGPEDACPVCDKEKSMPF